MTMNLNIVIKILVKVFFFLYNYIKKVDDYMNKKGFTLVELLAVIIILSLLALLASTSVSKIVKDSKSDLYDTQINLIKSAYKRNKKINKFLDDIKQNILKKINLMQTPKAERDVVVAAASIMARARFLEELQKLVKDYVDLI